MPFISIYRPFGIGKEPYLGDVLTMTINHFLVFLVQNPIFRTNWILIAIKHAKSIIWGDPYVRH